MTGHLRRFLYISPYFPPQSRVGALRPLKFARHLPDHGWAPVVLCDLWPSASINLELLEKIPKSTLVIRDYSRRAVKAEASMWDKAPPVAKPARKGGSKLSRFIPESLNNPELVPLGEHSVHMPHAVAAAKAALKRHPECEAIMVNADPYAALLVGASVAKWSGLPLIQDLRDPWSVCELRRSRRPPPIRRLVDGLERRAFEAASKVILNTETTYRDTVAHYEGVLPASRFARIRNHSERALISSGSHEGFEQFTLLFLGNFRRFLEGDVLFEVLAALKRRGLGAKEVKLVVTGRCPPEAFEAAAQMGVADMLVDHPFVAYTHIGPVMAAADVLVALSNRSTQRIPAKFYDYATVGRPVLALADNTEFGGLVEAAGGSIFGLDAPEAVADEVVRTMAGGRRQEIEVPALGLSSEEATAVLAGILDEVSGVK